MMHLPMYKIIDEYKRLNPNGRWFDHNTMKFFRSRLPNYGTLHGNTYYFISSEDSGQGRRYTIRSMNEQGTIDRVGPFYAYTKREARKELAHNILKCKVKDLY